MWSSSAARTVIQRGGTTTAVSLFPRHAWTAHVRTKTTTAAAVVAATATRTTKNSLLYGSAKTQLGSSPRGVAYFSANSSTSSSSSAEFSIYEYPNRTEAPEITTTKAVDVAATVDIDDDDQQQQLGVQPPTKSYSPDDPFDDTRQLSAEERRQARLRQRTSGPAGEGPSELSSLPITRTVPPFIPPNVPSKDLTVPETLITTLPNGIRVASQEMYTQMCTVGVLTNVGSRHEDVPGTIHLLETMAFGSTSQYDGLEITQLLQDWGATRYASHSREQTLYCIDILRPNVHRAVHLLAEAVLEPRIMASPAEVEHAKEVMEYQANQYVPELALGEALQMAAYGADQQLGKLHFGTPESIPLLNAQLVEDFHNANIKNNPRGMVIAGAGIAHDELVDMAQRYFGHLEQKSNPTTIPSVYRGGEHFITKPSAPPMYGSTLPDQEQCRVAMAFPVGGWHSDDMVTACVLQTLLGGGSSFSAGGPGKGMYTRMYQEVLNRYGWMETAEAFTTFADEGGLLGVSASTPEASRVPELVTILADQLARLALQPVKDVELSRARNMLKCNVLTQLESRLILFEDIGRQVLTYGKREDAAATCRMIEQVTANDIQRLAQKMMQNGPPTLAATGTHLEKIPSYEDVSRWFR